MRLALIRILSHTTPPALREADQQAHLPQAPSLCMWGI